MVTGQPDGRLIRCSVPVSGSTPMNSSACPERSTLGRLGPAQPAAGIGEDDHLAPLDAGSASRPRPGHRRQRVLHRLDGMRNICPTKARSNAATMTAPTTTATAHLQNARRAARRTVVPWTAGSTGRRPARDTAVSGLAGVSRARRAPRSFTMSALRSRGRRISCCRAPTGACRRQSPRPARVSGSRFSLIFAALPRRPRR